MAKHLFVYGTLLKGEEANSLLKGCILKEYTSIPGTLYDTGFGFPAADYSENVNSKIRGELYTLPPDHDQLLQKLDQYEDTENGIFKRISIKIEDKDSFIYVLKKPDISKSNQNISSGSWLLHNREIREDPLSFALNFEERHKFHYRHLSDDSIIYIPGNTGIIVSAPHATNHVRLNNIKIFERYTAALSALMNPLIGASSIYTNSVSISDPNYHDNCHYKEMLENLSNNNRYIFLLDVHGTGEEKEHDIYPGIGRQVEFLLGRTKYLDIFYETAADFGINCGSTKKYTASKEQTVTKYSALKLNIPSMQIEINRKFRLPEKHPDKFLRIVSFLREFLKKIKKE